MKVSDILRVKGNTLYTVTPDEPLTQAIEIMDDRDIGSLVVMDHGDLVGMLTFREVIQAVRAGKGSVGETLVRTHMDDAPPCLLYTSPSPRDVEESRMPSSA